MKLLATTIAVLAITAAPAAAKLAPDPPPGAKHAYIRATTYQRVQDVTQVYRWEYSFGHYHFVWVRTVRSRPYLRATFHGPWRMVR